MEKLLSIVLLVVLIYMPLTLYKIEKRSNINTILKKERKVLEKESLEK